MKTDIVFPNGNEEKFIEMALKLGYDSLVFIYDAEKKFYLKRTVKAIKIYNALVLKSQDARKKRNKTDLILVESTGNDRETLEKAKPDILFSIEEKQRKDYMHQRGSGLNSVLAKIASEKNVMIGFSFKSILENEKVRERIIGRMGQNIKLCRKYGIEFCIASFAHDPFQMRAYHDLVAFFIGVGMHPAEAKKGFGVVAERIIENRMRKKGKIKGVEVEITETKRGR